SMPDDDVAAELERSAGRAQARGGLAAVAAFLERAAALTPEPTHRGQRVLAAARARRDAGDLEAALGLLESVEASVLNELGRARVDLLRAQIALEQRRRHSLGLSSFCSRWTSPTRMSAGGSRSPAVSTATSLHSRCGTTRLCISSLLARCRKPATRAHSRTCSSRSASWRGARCSPA